MNGNRLQRRLRGRHSELRVNEACAGGSLSVVETALEVPKRLSPRMVSIWRLVS